MWWFFDRTSVLFWGTYAKEQDIHVPSQTNIGVELWLSYSGQRIMVLREEVWLSTTFLQKKTFGRERKNLRSYFWGRYVPMAGTKITCICPKLLLYMRRNLLQTFYWIHNISSPTEQIDDGRDGLVVTGYHHVMAVRLSGNLHTLWEGRL